MPMSPKASSHHRRTFLKTSLVVAGGSLALGPRMATASVLGANDRVRIGVIGTGGRTRYLMRLLGELPDNEIVAVSDVYEPRIEQAAEIAGGNVARHADYRRILDDREVHAVLIGSPDQSQADGTATHLGNWLDCVRSREQPTAPMSVAHEAARAAHIANLAMKKRTRVRWNGDAGKVEPAA